jgi:hypothetical protein
VVCAGIGVGLSASATLSPLYDIYRASWGLSSALLTLVFAAYAVGLLAGLLSLGGLSDRLGRRPVIRGSLVLLLVAAIVFVAARSAAWLFVGRLIQGAATGALLAAGTAALIDLETPGGERWAAALNGISVESGIALGALSASALVQFAPNPLLTPYLALIGLLVLALTATCVLRDDSDCRTLPALRLHFERPFVPPPIRRAFAAVSLAVLAAWSVAGAYMALGPSVVAGMIGEGDHLAAGASIVALSAPAALVQVVARRVNPHSTIQFGLLVLAVGMAITASGAILADPVTFFAGSLAVGVGFGLLVSGPIETLAPHVPEHHRGGLMAALYVVAYASFSIPVIAAGIAAAAIGLKSAFGGFGFLVTLTAVVAAARIRGQSTLGAGAENRAGQFPATGP